MTLTVPHDAEKTQLRDENRSRLYGQLWNRREEVAAGRAVHVLVVEAGAGAASPLEADLRRQGYDVNKVDTGVAAMKDHQIADLVLLDLKLPDIDGLEICRFIRATSDKPIIAFTSRDDELDRVLALYAGADDCVMKPCGIREVVARMEAVLRRAHARWSATQTIAVEQLRIDCVTREVRVGDQLVNLTGKEFEVLYLLASKPHAVVSRKELMSRVWDSDWTGTSRTIDTHVSSLRSKLGASTWITTVRGVGYRLGYGRYRAEG